MDFSQWLFVLILEAAILARSTSGHFPDGFQSVRTACFGSQHCIQVLVSGASLTFTSLESPFL